MKSLTMMCILSAIPFAQISRADENAQLTGIGVVFNMPKCDDRDRDTKIDMWIEKGGARLATALNLAPGQHFDDPGSYGPFPFSLDRAVTKAHYRGSLTRLAITPHGNDTWCTTITITASFSDGSVLKSSTGGAIKVSESNRTAQFVNQ